MVVFKFSETREKGTYKPSFTEQGRRTANIICPSCGTMLHLDPHKINTEGVVSPSVVCHGCNFHEFIRLEEWGD